MPKQAKAAARRPPRATAGKRGGGGPSKAPTRNAKGWTETAEQRTARAARVMAALAGAYPDAKVALEFTDPLEMVVATVLSAQCTDAKVNEVTRTLFKRYRTARDYAEAPPGELEELIHATGFFNFKAKLLRGLGRTLVDRFGGEVPRTMDELVELPGVARKTANIVLGNAFGVVEGIAVDTHVRRLAQRLGLDYDPVNYQLNRHLKEFWVVTTRKKMRGAYLEYIAPRYPNTIFINPGTGGVLLIIDPMASLFGPLSGTGSRWTAPSARRPSSRSMSP